MATNTDRSLYAAPTGIDEDLEDPQEVEIEIEIAPEDGEDIDDVDGLMVLAGFADIPFEANLAEYMDENDLGVLASDLVANYENDLLSRQDWEKTYTEGMKLLGLKTETRSEPWEGASGVFHPMITEAVVRFQAESITESFPASGPVKTTIIGESNREKEMAAKRVAEDMNYQLTEKMPEFRPEHERMLWNLPLAGSAFKKVYFDPSLGRQVSMFVPAEDVILPYGVSEISMCPRLTHRMRKTTNQINKLIQSGFYSDVELPEPNGNLPDEVAQEKDKQSGFSAIFDDRHVLLEMHVELDLVGFEDADEEGEFTGIALPYVVTIDKESNTVLSIRRNYAEDAVHKDMRQHFVHYQYVPGFGAYGFGLIHLIGNSAAAATALQRQLIDAGTLANLPGGLKTRGLRIKGDDSPIAPGEFRDVDVGSGTIKENIMTLPYKEPSQTLLAMMGIITEDARRLSSTADMKISDMSAQAPVGTTLAIIERSLKILSAVQARMHFSLKQELKLLAAIIRDYADPEYSYDAQGETRELARQTDFSYVDIIPVSDPNASTMAQRVVQYQAVLQLAQSAPQLYNMALLHRQMLEVLGVKNAEKLVKLDEDQKPEDPVTENMNLLTGKPLKVFMYQDHEAHIRTHMAAMQDPKIMQLMGQNPNAQTMMAQAQGHIAEHVAYAYRREMEKQMGVTLPGNDADLPPHVEAEMSRSIADAADKLLGKNQAEAQAAENAKKSQDPVIQMQQQELAIKQGDLDLRKNKLAVDAAMAADNFKLKQELEAARVQIEAYKASGTLALGQAKIDARAEEVGLTTGVDVAKTQATIAANQEQQGLKIGVDLAKTVAAAKMAADAAKDEKLPEQPTLGTGSE